MEIFLGSLLLVSISFCIRADEDLSTGYKISIKNHNEGNVYIDLNGSQNSSVGLRINSKDNYKQVITRKNIADNKVQAKSKWYFQQLSAVDDSRHGEKDWDDEMSLSFKPERRVQSSSLRYFHTERVQPGDKGRENDLNNKIASVVHSERKAEIIRNRNSRLERLKLRSNSSSDKVNNNLNNKMVSIFEPKRKIQSASVRDFLTERFQSSNKNRSDEVNNLNSKMELVFESKRKTQSASSVGVRDFHTERPGVAKKICRWSPNGQRRQCLKRRKKKKLVNSAVGKPGTQGESNFSSKSNDSRVTIVNDRSRINGELRKRNFGDDITNIINARVSGDDKNRLSENGTDRSDPCACVWSLQNCGCECRGSLNYDDFMDLSKIFRPCTNFKFTLAEGRYYALPPNFFANLLSIHTFNMSITNATFEYLLDPTPMTSPFNGVHFSVSALITLRNVSVRRGWNWTPFEKLEGNQNARAGVFIEGCVLRRLTSDFSNMASGRVRDITVANSNLTMIGSAAFKTFVNMTHLRLPGNKITSIRREDLPRRPSMLEKIDFCNNQLQYLEDNMFTEMPSLKEVALSGNPFKVLSEKTFYDVITRVNLLGISDFPLNCNCELQWLKDPKIVDNEIIKKNMLGATCRKPRYLRGTPLQNLAKEHLVCQ